MEVVQPVIHCQILTVLAWYLILAENN